jgi:hypothetical protein
MEAIYFQAIKQVSISLQALQLLELIYLELFIYHQLLLFTKVRFVVILVPPTKLKELIIIMD